MLKLTRLSYYMNGMIFSVSWTFLPMWIFIKLMFTDDFKSLQYPMFGGIVLAFATIGFSYGVLYFLIFVLLPKIFSEVLGSLTLLPALLRINNYYMGNLAGSSPSYQSVLNKYNEWIREGKGLEKVGAWKSKKNTIASAIFIASILVGFLTLKFL